MSPTPVQQRFDDRLATILAIDTSSQNGANSLWTQLVDLLAQGREQLSVQQIERALAALAILRDGVQIDVRRQGASAIARRCCSAPLVVLLSGDASPIVCALFDRLQLSENDWQAVMPMIGPLARSRLRMRMAELPASAARSLDMLAAGDLSLPQQRPDVTVHSPSTEEQPIALVEAAPMASTDEPALGAIDVPVVSAGDLPETPSSIAELVRRIDDWQKRRPANDASTLNASSSEIRLTVDTDGFVRAVEGMPNAALCGLSLAEPARPGETGVDAGVARAFARRAPVASGRIYIAAGLPWSGLWALTAAPLFAADSGRFLGYRGVIVPADVGGREVGGRINPNPSVEMTPQPLAEAMRQMVHELRSPLNAISGFSQLIEGQYFGPVATNYRAMAQGIRRDAAALLQVFDDLDLAARMDLGSNGGVKESVDLVAAVRDAASSMDDGGTVLETSTTAVKVVTSPEPLRSLLARLMALTADPVAINRPVASLYADASRRLAVLEMRGMANADDDAGHGSPMGQEFSLRLIEELAIRAGATIDFIGNKAILNFPIAMDGGERVVAGIS